MNAAQVRDKAAAPGAIEEPTVPSASSRVVVGDLANLDIVRAIAVTLVFVSHVPTWKARALAAGFTMGTVGIFGVSIFFVHTSLVLLASLERLGRGRGAEPTYLRFVVRRIFRLYPLSILMVILMEAFARLGWWPSVGLRATIADLLLVQNLTGMASTPDTLWSLPYEMQMYLVLPLLFDVALKAGRRAFSVLVVAWAVVVLFCLALYFAGWHPLFSLFQRVKYAGHFLPGAVAFATFRAATRRELPAWLVPTSLVLAAVLLPWVVSPDEPLATIAQWSLCMALALLIPRCRESSSTVVNSAAKTVAKYSYGIYLVHFPCIELVYGDHSPIPSALRLATVIGATALLSVAFYHFIEEPCIKLGKRLTARVPSTRAREAGQLPR